MASYFIERHPRVVLIFWIFLLLGTADFVSGLLLLPKDPNSFRTLDAAIIMVACPPKTSRSMGAVVI
jgi:hypothetical protein